MVLSELGFRHRLLFHDFVTTFHSFLHLPKLFIFSFSHDFYVHFTHFNRVSNDDRHATLIPRGPSLPSLILALWLSGIELAESAE